MTTPFWLIPAILLTTLQHGVHVEADNLHSAALSGDLHSLDRLIEAGTDINGQDHFGKTALHLAAESGNIPTTRWLVERSANPNLLDLAGASPLVYAVRGGHAAIVGLLISGGADVRILDKDGRTALDEAENKDLDFQIIIQMLGEVDHPR